MKRKVKKFNKLSDLKAKARASVGLRSGMVIKSKKARLLEREIEREQIADQQD